MIKATILDEHIVDEVIDGLDQSDRMIRLAAKEFLNNYRIIMEQEVNNEDIIHVLESEEAIDAIIQVHRQVIEAIAARHRVELAEKKLELAKQQVIVAINEFEDIASDEDWSLDMHHMVLTRNHENEDTFAVFEFVKQIADGTAEISLESIHEGKIPECLEPTVKRNDGIRVLLRDLADFLIESGVKGLQLLNDIFDDINKAIAIAMDEDMALPIRAIASSVLKVKNQKTALV
jgi:hypothetical protein